MASNFDLERNLRMVFDVMQGMTYQEAGEKYGVTRQRVWNLCHKPFLKWEMKGKRGKKREAIFTPL